MLAMVREDAVCRRLMTVPGVGPLVAMTDKSAIDDPSRITKSKAAGALFGLTPKKYQSGERTLMAGSSGPATRWCGRHSMKQPMFC
jgi:transposase